MGGLPKRESILTLQKVEEVSLENPIQPSRVPSHNTGNTIQCIALSPNRI